jgi:hypothetical protein
MPSTHRANDNVAPGGDTYRAPNRLETEGVGYISGG